MITHFFYSARREEIKKTYVVLARPYERRKYEEDGVKKIQFVFHHIYRRQHSIPTEPQNDAKMCFPSYLLSCEK